MRLTLRITGRAERRARLASKTMAKEKKRGRGRPRSPEPKKAVNYRFREVVTKEIHKLKKAGKYSSLDAVVEDAILHVRDCDRFVPGAGGLVFTKEGEVEAIDLSEL